MDREEGMMTARSISRLALAVLLLMPVAVVAQTTTPGAGIDVEIYNPVDGTNTFCVNPGETFWANVYVRPGDNATTCSQTCGMVAGGTNNIGTAAVDLAFDPAVLSLVSAENNPDPGFAAVDGLIQTQNAAFGYVGWALAGDWMTDGDPMSGLNNACDMLKLDGPGWVYRVQFSADAYGPTSLTVRQQPDFELSFADMCGGPAFTVASADIDEVVSAQVVIPCTTVLFLDGFEDSTTSAWSETIQ